MNTSNVSLNPACCLDIVVVGRRGGTVRPDVYVHLIKPLLGVHKPRVVGKKEWTHPQGVHLRANKLKQHIRVI